ncbi:hypothetical protein GGF31_008796 [Allomyces arbusculus]|nr:hypothetical protein GGF31_008796 [Allomyces arbusculus]
MRLSIPDLSDSMGKSIAPPPGFALGTLTWTGPRSTGVQKSAAKAAKDEEKKRELRTKKAWDLAYSGAKSIPMNLIMMYMTGNSLQIFSIFFTVMMFWNPIKSLMGVNKVFLPLERSGDVDLTLPKLAFVGLQLANVLLALYKCQQMGLLPTTESDWLAFMGGAPHMERSVGRITF